MARRPSRFQATTTISTAWRRSSATSCTRAGSVAGDDRTPAPVPSAQASALTYGHVVAAGADNLPVFPAIVCAAALHSSAGACWSISWLKEASLFAGCCRRRRATTLCGYRRAGGSSAWTWPSSTISTCASAGARRFSSRHADARVLLCEGTNICVWLPFIVLCALCAHVVRCAQLLSTAKSQLWPALRLQYCLPRVGCQRQKGSAAQVLCADSGGAHGGG